MRTPEAATGCAANLSEVMLNSYLDKNISQICPHGYADPSLNHCAHFVSHASNYSAGSTTCRGMSRSTAAGIGVCIRVHELFRDCPLVGVFDQASEDQKTKGFFIFVTAETAVQLQTKTMTNVPKKHVGIYFAGTIWHYSNTRDKVVTATPDEFRHHYRGQRNGLYFGSFPSRAQFSSQGCGR